MTDPGAQVIAERFLVRKKLGSGAAGTVYEVLDRQRNAVVALKTLRQIEPVALYRFKREFRALSHLNHPNLVRLHELHSAGDSWFFTMERIDGVHLRDWVRVRTSGAPTDAEVESTHRTGVLPQRVVRDDARLRAALPQLAQGLAALHREGKLHRDIKPSNVLVARDGRVVLCDFGLVADTGRPRDETAERRVVGTPAYMSPEQAAGETATEASDWYSVGVLLHELLTGMLPIEAALVPAADGRGPSPRAHDSTVGEDLDALCRDLLAPDPDDRPGDVDVLRRLGVAAPTPRRASDAPFVGRADELAALQRGLAAVGDGSGPVICRVHGASGMGKSALLRRFLDAVSAGATVLEGRCFEQEWVPYKALDAVVDALTRELLRLPEEVVDQLVPRHVMALARLFPVLRRVDAVALPRAPVLEPADPQESRRRAFTAMRELIGGLARLRPLVIAIDDLQWGDTDSAALVAELLRPPEAPALLLLCAYRTEEAEASPFLRDLSEPLAGAATIEVGPLAATEVGDLAAALGAPVDRPGGAALARESAGSPFLVAELIRYREDAATGAAPTLEEMIARRLDHLPAPARGLLEAVAVASRPIGQAIARQVAQIEDDADGALDRLRAAHLVRTRGVRQDDPVECYHDRIRETVVAGLDSETLARWHRRLAIAFEAAGDPNREAIAAHFHGAGDDDRAAHYAVLAAKQAGDALAFDRAAHLYRFALAARVGDRRRTAQLEERLAAALVCAGRGAEAAEAYLRAADDAPGADALEYRRRAAEQLLRSGHVDEGMEVMRGVIVALDMTLPATPRRALVSLLLRRARLRLRGERFRARDRSQISPAELVRLETCWSVSAGLGMVDTMRGMEYQTRYILAALDTGDRLHLSRALAAEGMYRSTAGAAARVSSQRMIDRANQLADEVGDPATIGLGRGARAMSAYMVGDYRAARDGAQAALDRFRNQCTGVAWEIDSAELIVLWALYYLGELGELGRRVPLLAREARERGDLFAETSYAVGLPAMGWLAAGDADGYRKSCAAVMARWSRRDYHLQHYWQWCSDSQVDLYLGDGAAAVAGVRDAWPRIRGAMFLRLSAVRIESWDLRGRAALAAASSAGADRTACLREVASAARALARERLGSAAALAAMLRAAIAEAERGADAAAEWSLATEAAAAAQMAMHAHVCRRRRGQLLAGDAGAALVATADTALRAEGIIDPDRWSAMLAPSVRW